ncbi:ribosomal protein S18-alanine N-acetyltransferase [Clostridium sp.]|uniref:ribosomal protein S18-alanine N-acetyltransferase n=1 Tax=Clostridium sp. TaxID=1506 RepID=UPI002FCC5599
MEKITLNVMNIMDVEGVHNVSNLSLKEGWSLLEISKEISNELAHYIVLKDNDKVIAFAGAWIVADEGQITNVAVHPNYRGKGYGNKVMKALIDHLTSKECYDITLEVRESNKIAQNLYESLGFKNEGIRKNFYEDNKESAVIMWLHK